MLQQIKKFTLAFSAGLLGVLGATILIDLLALRLAHASAPGYRGEITIDFASVFCRPFVFFVELLAFSVGFWIAARRMLSRR